MPRQEPSVFHWLKSPKPSIADGRPDGWRTEEVLAWESVNRRGS